LAAADIFLRAAADKLRRLETVLIFIFAGSIGCACTRLAWRARCAALIRLRALSLAHRALAAADILLRAAADNRRRLEPVLIFILAALIGFAIARLTRRARCAATMGARAAPETMFGPRRPCRTGGVLVVVVSRPTNPSSTEIAESSLSTCKWASLRWFRSCRSALSKLANLRFFLRHSGKVLQASPF